MKAKPTPLDYGKGEFGGGGVDVRGAGGGGGTPLPRTPGQARAAATARGEAAPRGKRSAVTEGVARQTKKMVDETTDMQHQQDPTVIVNRDAERQKYLKGLPNQYFRKGGIVTNDYAKGRK